MANLIIKPSASGSLILQDEGGSPAITVGTTGLTTFAENATLSGTANNLGTVTAGTLGTGVDFDTCFPFTSTAMNIGKMRIVCVHVTSSASASSGTVSPFTYYTSLNVSYSGFSSIKSIHMDVQVAAANVRTTGISTFTTTAAGGYISSPTASETESKVCMFTIIGVAS